LLAQGGAGALQSVPMLAVDAVRFGYGDTPVLAAVDLRVEAAAIVCIVGANGAGKSTLVRIIAGLLSPGAGSVRVFGQDPARAPRHSLARRLAYVPQEYRLSVPFTVREVVLMGRYPHRRGNLLGLESTDDVARAEEAMARCDVGHLAARRFDALSGGERRRALLAQAFCQQTDLVLLDEPTASLDPAHAIAVFESLRDETAARGATAVVVTHDLNLAGRFADRLVVLDRGRIVADGAPRQVLTAAATARAFAVDFHVGTLPETDAPFAVPHNRSEPR